MMRRYDEPEKRIMKPCDPEEFHQILDELMDDARVREMKRFTQHGNISTFDHCRNVATLSQRLNRRLRLKADEATLLKGAMLHEVADPRRCQPVSDPSGHHLCSEHLVRGGHCESGRRCHRLSGMAFAPKA